MPQKKLKKGRLPPQRRQFQDVMTTKKIIESFTFPFWCSVCLVDLDDDDDPTTHRKFIFSHRIWSTETEHGPRRSPKTWWGLSLLLSLHLTIYPGKGTKFLHYNIKTLWTVSCINKPEQCWHLIYGKSTSRNGKHLFLGNSQQCVGERMRIVGSDK